jgi:hypothetical protein
MNKQESSDFPGGMGQFRTRRGLGRMLSGLAAVGAIAAAVSGEEAAGKKKKKRASSGVQGPSGPVGPIGPEGPAGTPVTFISVTAERSAVLGATAGGEVQSVAECGLESVPVNCGWSYIGSTSEFDRTVTEVRPGFFREVGMCTVSLRRTATVGAAGGQVIATAICTR